jgi:hypothetical protein
MRQDKTVARILLIFSAANVVLASHAVVRQSHMDVAKAASEKRAADNVPPQEPEPFRLATSGAGAVPSDPPPPHQDISPSGSSRQDLTIAPGTDLESSEAATKAARIHLGVGLVAVLGATAGVAYLFHKVIETEYVSPLSPLSCQHLTESQTFWPMIFLSKSANSVPRDLPNSDVVGRGGGKHQSRKQLVSRGLANLRDEDLQLLNVLARRALESIV